ncbi:MAG: isoprenyl transferase [Desulfosudaceae bacterium]
MNFNHSAEYLRRDLDENRLPAHIAIIMDGNGRWAKKRSLHRLEGHRRGVETIEEVISACRDIPIPCLTLFAFSTENWNRPDDEVAGIMSLLQEFLANQQKKLKDNGIRLNVVGERRRLPREVDRALAEALAFTSDGTSMVLTIALSYGGRSEISRAARKLAEAARDGLVAPEDIDEEMFASCLYTSDLPDPDLLIRTSGEMRISNFLLWQLAYTEIFITETLWPDFGTEELLAIIKSYQNRDRRFGKV